MMHEFADRIRRKKTIATPTREVVEKDSDDPTLLAAQTIDISKVQADAFKIYKPRASAMHDGCMRMFVIGRKEGVKKKEWSTAKGRLLFGIGNAIHYWIQNRPILLGNNRVGWWKCLACGKIRDFGRPPLKPCKFCGALPAAAEYYEHPMNIEGKWPVTGHPDMLILKSEIKATRVLEIKSINGEDFQRLIAPHVQHEYQVMTYMTFLPLDKTLPVKVDPDVGYVLYVSKKHMAKELPMKMFVVNRVDDTVKRIKKKCTDYRVGFENYPNRLPAPTNECMRSNFTSWRANQCPAKKKCLKLLDG